MVSDSVLSDPKAPRQCSDNVLMSTYLHPYKMCNHTLEKMSEKQKPKLYMIILVELGMSLFLFGLGLVFCLFVCLFVCFPTLYIF